MRTMGFQRKTLHLDYASAPAVPASPDAAPEQPADDQKNREEDGLPAENAKLRRQEAVVEAAIEKLPEN